MSKRKKTPTSKNTQPKLTKAQLTKKITAMDRIELEKVAGQKGIMGAAFRINYHEKDGSFNRKEAACSKCIQPMERLLSTPNRYGLNQEELEEMATTTASLTHKIYNNQFPNKDPQYDLAGQMNVLFTMLMAYVFSKQNLIDYCIDKREATVGILVVFNVEYDVELDEFETNLSIRSRDNFEDWIIDSTELVSEDKATILKG